jgi:transcriptional regulator with XRE-family HTH domain
MVRGAERDRMAQRMREILIEAREALDLNQTDLAAVIGRTQSFVSNYERGQRRVDVAEFILLARALKIDPVAAVAELAGNDRGR